MTNGKPFILFAASECAPLCKTGGLADVVGALPKALSRLSVRSAVILPFYSLLPANIRSKARLIAKLDVKIGRQKKYAGLLTADYKGRTYYFIDNEEYFRRDNLYGYFEDAERYIFFSLAVVAALEYIDGVDIIHCNDWQTAMIPVAVSHLCGDTDACKGIKTVFTIHNLRFQGRLEVKDFADMLNLTGTHPWLFEAIHYGQANLLKAALYSADIVTTVSPNYAFEIKHAYYGETLEGCIREISSKLKGIINGIDTKSFDPAADGLIYSRYEEPSGKKQNKRSFLNEYALPGKDNMMIGMVTRLDSQKGLDLVLYAIERIIELPVYFVLLGTGESVYESAFRELEARHHDRARCFIMYDEALARKIYAACDVFLMPSKFEPCGLGQLIAMRYGALPIVRETGGLADTVEPYNETTGEGTGFSFANYNGDELSDSVERAYKLYSGRRITFNTLAGRAMEQDFGWSRSAREYKKLYASLVTSKGS